MTGLKTHETELGLLPCDWEVLPADDVCHKVVDCKNRTPPVIDGGDFAVVRTTNVRNGRFVEDGLRFTDEESFKIWTKRAIPQTGDVMITREAPLGEVCLVPENHRVCLGQRMMMYRPDTDKVGSEYLLYALLSERVQRNLRDKLGGSTVGHARVDDIRMLKVPIPQDVHEQDAIANALSDVDDLIAGLEALIAKKRDLKTATMQQLLTGKTRLPGFGGDWQALTLFDAMDCLDNLRIPLNSNQRKAMPGDIPYCGANGVVDYVGRHTHEGDIVLIAEDGGYFDEYATRPIAYRVSGKSWVNNHAHVLVAKPGFSQSFLFHSLVHKNILDFLASGTRAKLNKAQMWKIPLYLPECADEQAEVASVLDDIENEIDAISTRVNKAKALKQGMMQELLTGRTRLI